MRKLTTSVVGIVLVGLTLIFVSGRKTAAAPGFSLADFKGVYVGHYNGRSALGPTSGTILLNADGMGAFQARLLSFVPPDGPFCNASYSYVVGSDGHVEMSNNAVGVDFFGYIADRGKTIEFTFIQLCSGNTAYGGSGAATIQ